MMSGKITVSQSCDESEVGKLENPIRGIVYSKFSSVREFAKAVGWDRTKACNIINMTREPRLSDLQDMAPVVDMSIEGLAHIFLQKSSQNCDNGVTS